MDRLRTYARELRCNGTNAERKLWQVLRRRQMGGYKFRRQHPLAGYIVDFVCLEARLVVELDGGQHADAVAYDARRSQVLAAQGFRVIRFWNHDVLQRTDDVVAEIWRNLTHDQA